MKNMKNVENFARQLGKVICGVTAGMVINEAGKHVQNNDYTTTVVGYGEAVDEIMKSNMWSSDKRAAIKLLKRNEKEDYYKAVISIVKSSDMFSVDRVRMIRDFND